MMLCCCYMSIMMSERDDWKSKQQKRMTHKSEGEGDKAIEWGNQRKNNEYTRGFSKRGHVGNIGRINTTANRDKLI